MIKIPQEELISFLSPETKEILFKFNIEVAIFKMQQEIYFAEIRENNEIIIDDGINIRGIPEEYINLYMHFRIQEMLSKFFQKKWKLNR